MSQVARVFVVLNLLLAVGFLFASATFLASNNDFKKKLDDEQAAHTADNDRNAARIGELDSSVRDKDNQNRALEERNGSLQGQVDTLTQQVSAAEADKKAKDTQIADLTRNNNEFAASVANLRNDKNNLTANVERVSEENRQKAKEAAEAVAALDGARAEIVGLQNTIAEQEKTIVGQKETIDQKELVINYCVSKGIDVSNIVVASPVQGYVVNADNNMNLVQVNVGAAAGVKRGIVLDIVRGDRYIGRMMVQQVTPNHSAGLLELTAPGQRVMVGDRVTNTLN